jgi:hypothetical protein
MFVEETVNINGIEGLSNIQRHRRSPRALFLQNESPNVAWCVQAKRILLKFTKEVKQTFVSIGRGQHVIISRPSEWTKRQSVFLPLDMQIKRTGTNNFLRKVNDCSGRRFRALFVTSFGTGTLPNLRDLMILAIQQRWLVEVLLQKQTVCSHQLINHPNDRQFR